MKRRRLDAMSELTFVSVFCVYMRYGLHVVLLEKCTVSDVFNVTSFYFCILHLLILSLLFYVGKI